MWHPSAADKGRAAVLAALRESASPVSGQELSKALGLSRNAVWKYVLSLRECGYTINAAPRRGYSLSNSPDTPFSWEVTAGARTRWLGRTAIYLPRTSSTNTIAKEAAKQGAPAGLCVLAGAQTGGRGRRGRTWVSPPGGLFCTVLFRPALHPAQAPFFGLCAASAVAGAIRTACGLPAEVKWPNDVLVHGRKVCGILVEMSAEAQEIHWLVVGMGVNVDMTAADLPAAAAVTASSLSMEKSAPVRKLPLLHEILTGLEIRYDQLAEGESAALLSEIRTLSATLGKNVTLLQSSDAGTGAVVSAAAAAVTEGLAEDITEDGALCLRLGDGSVRRFYAGEVSLRTKDA